MNNKTAAHVVLGLDKEGKPRAALVHPADLEAATKAAAALGLSIGRADSPQALTMAKRLPDAKLFATGKGLVPLVRKDIFEWLTKGLVPLEAKADPEAPKAVQEASPGGSSASDQPAGTQAAEKPPAAKDSSPDRPDTSGWDKLVIGSQVIAPDKDPAEDGWWPAVITGISKDGQRLTLRWRDVPKLPPITVKRYRVALLLHPHS